MQKYQIKEDDYKDLIIDNDREVEMVTKKTNNIENRNEINISDDSDDYSSESKKIDQVYNNEIVHKTEQDVDRDLQTENQIEENLKKIIQTDSDIDTTSKVKKNFEEDRKTIFLDFISSDEKEKKILKEKKIHKNKKKLMKEYNQKKFKKKKFEEPDYKKKNVIAENYYNDIYFKKYKNIDIDPNMIRDKNDIINEKNKKKINKSSSDSESLEEIKKKDYNLEYIYSKPQIIEKKKNKKKEGKKEKEEYIRDKLKKEDISDDIKNLKLVKINKPEFIKEIVKLRKQRNKNIKDKFNKKYIIKKNLKNKNEEQIMENFDDYEKKMYDKYERENKIYDKKIKINKPLNKNDIGSNLRKHPQFAELSPEKFYKILDLYMYIIYYIPLYVEEKEAKLIKVLSNINKDDIIYLKKNSKNRNTIIDYIVIKEPIYYSSINNELQFEEDINKKKIMKRIIDDKLEEKKIPVFDLNNYNINKLKYDEDKKKEILDNLRIKDMKRFTTANPINAFYDDLNSSDFVEDNPYIDIEIPPTNFTIEENPYTFLGLKLRDLNIKDSEKIDNLFYTMYTYNILPPEMYKYVKEEAEKLTAIKMLKMLKGYIYQGFYDPLRLSNTIKDLVSKVGKYALSSSEIMNNLILKQDKYMSVDEMKEALKQSTFLEDPERFTNETLIQLFYVNSSLTDADKLHKFEKNDEIIKILADRVKTINEENVKIQNNLKNIMINPKIYEEESKGIFKLVKKELILLDHFGYIKTFKPEYLAKVIKNTFSKKTADPVSVVILAKTSPYDLKLLKKVVQEYYIGTGNPSNMINRYNKSLKIYQESNGEIQKEFHKKIYQESFDKFMEEFNYVDRHIINIPEDYTTFLFSMTENATGRFNKVIYINSRAKGTFTSYFKRDRTAINEIESSLYHFHRLGKDDSSKLFFQLGFKFICAKVKNEIHSEKKDPRFFNPTMISAFTPFQFMLNSYFSKIKNFDQNNYHNLLGISNEGTTFSKVMNYFYFKNGRFHYSDNFWICEDDFVVSIDVERCDSNLSKEALTIPLKFIAERTLKDDDLKNMLILIELFGENIPRDALFSIGPNSNKMYEIEVNNEVIITNPAELYTAPFYWLPSGVVGTAYINHMYTGFFLYLTKNIKWINNKGELTEEVIKESKNYGIHLKIASKVYRKFNPEVFKIYDFDLLGQSGMYLGNETFCPLLEEERFWKTMAFMKSQFYDSKGMFALYVRMNKAISMMSMGSMLRKQTYQSSYAFLVAIAPYLKKQLLNLSRNEIKILEKILDENDMPLDSYVAGVFNPINLTPNGYIQLKTGKNLEPPPEVQNMFQNIEQRIEEINVIKTAFSQIVASDINIVKKKAPIFLKDSAVTKEDFKRKTNNYFKTFLYSLWKDVSLNKKDKKNDFVDLLRILSQFMNTNMVVDLFTKIFRLLYSKRTEKVFYNNKNFNDLIELQFKKIMLERLQNKQTTIKNYKKMEKILKKDLQNINSMNLDIVVEYLNDGRKRFFIEFKKPAKIIGYILNYMDFFPLFEKYLDDVVNLILKEKDYSYILNYLGKLRLLHFYPYKKMFNKGNEELMPEVIEDKNKYPIRYLDIKKLKFLNKIYFKLKKKGIKEQEFGKIEHGGTPFGIVNLYLKRIIPKKVERYLEKHFNKFSKKERKDLIEKFKNLDYYIENKDVLNN